MTLAPAAMSESNHPHGRLLRVKGTISKCAGVCTIREDGPFKYPSKSQGGRTAQTSVNVVLKMWSTL
ncbi:hypothetical protein KIN20_001565 [Parelaphostrongylus tenuis]|uniref:Uncharacterized protein n=1 Tax=Parelaphostrongylus tenuis TaxID=148309 RepID=A0AAD5QCQ0_PARTN|nr:hypothetical protein KIN20_001565 [Parelaphostrongylus tenuis]